MNDFQQPLIKTPTLDNLNHPSEIKEMSWEDLAALTAECREKIIEVTSKTGGHLASSLGTVELTVALAKAFDLAKDKIVFDVGHQAYTYKLITDRKDRLEGLGKQGGIAKFLTRSESPYDHFGAGHASTSISAALGMGVARRLKQETYKTIAIIGDGSMTGGLAFEALNHAGHLDEDLIVILNDNEMSIDPVVGALSKAIINISSSKTFNFLRGEISRHAKEKRLPMTLKNGLKRMNDSFMAFFTHGVWFEKLNFRYFGQIDGHDIKDLVSLFEHTKSIKGPILLHVSTQKGKGYHPAEGDTLSYHGVGAFDKATGIFHPKPKTGPSYTDIFSQTIGEILAQDETSVAISAAMLANTGLAPLQKLYPHRVFDVGIAEGHAVTFAGGLATQGIRPWVVIYSTFLQRAFDHIVHDICLQNLPVRFVLDRGGFVGPDGATHHGVLDLGFLRMIPNMVLLAPKNGPELVAMLRFMHHYDQGPIALRFPRANCEEIEHLGNNPLPQIELGKGELIRSGTDALILAAGTMVQPGLELLDQLNAKGYNIGLINLRFIKPLDRELILAEAQKAKTVITLEENALAGGLGSAVMEFLAQEGVVKPILPCGIPDFFIEQGSREQQMQKARLDTPTLQTRIIDFLTRAKEQGTA